MPIVDPQETAVIVPAAVSSEALPFSVGAAGLTPLWLFRHGHWRIGLTLLVFSAVIAFVALGGEVSASAVCAIVWVLGLGYASAIFALATVGHVGYLSSVVELVSVGGVGYGLLVGEALGWAIALAFGFEGNKIAMKHHRYRSLDALVKGESRWNKAGAIFLCIRLLGLVAVAMFVVISFYGKRH